MKLTSSQGTYRLLAAFLCVTLHIASARADEKGRALLRNAESVFRKAHSIQVEITEGDLSAKGGILFRTLRPGRFSLALGETGSDRSVITCDGTRVFQCDEASKTCTTLDAASLFEMGNVVPSFFLATAFLEPGLLPQMETPVYAGLIHRYGQTFQSVRCAATSERGAWTLFFDSTGALAGIESEAFQSTTTTAPAQRAWLRNARVNQSLQEGDFKCALPAGFQMAKSDNPVNELLPMHVPAPSFSMPTLDGKKATLDSALRGHKALLLNITFAECGACISEVPSLKHLYGGLKDKGLAILAVNIVDDRQAAQKVLDKYHLPYPMGLDSKAGGGTEDVGTRYHANAGGLNILIGPDKKIVWEEAGLNEKHLRCVLERLGIPAVSRM